VNVVNGNNPRIDKEQTMIQRFLQNLFHFMYNRWRQVHTNAILAPFRHWQSNGTFILSFHTFVCKPL